MGFPGGSDSKEATCNARDLGLIPGLGKSPGGGNANPLQYSCRENPHGQRSLYNLVHETDFFFFSENTLPAPKIYTYSPN